MDVNSNQMETKSDRIVPVRFVQKWHQNKLHVSRTDRSCIDKNHGPTRIVLQWWHIHEAVGKNQPENITISKRKTVTFGCNKPGSSY